MGSPTVVYRVDGLDRILSVNEAWDAFADGNDGEGARADMVVGQSLFAYITDPATRLLYRQMLLRIRTGGNMHYAFRCDSAECRRLMEMQVRLVDDQGTVEFRSITLEEQPRDPIAVTSLSASGDTPQPACGWCNRLQVDGDWLEIEEALPRLRLLERDHPPSITHGICGTCYERMAAELELQPES